VEVDPRFTSWKPGQRVVVTRLHHVRELCLACLAGRQNLCRELEGPQASTAQQGTYASSWPCPASALYPLPEGLSAQEAVRHRASRPTFVHYFPDRDERSPRIAHHPRRRTDRDPDPGPWPSSGGFPASRSWTRTRRGFDRGQPAPRGPGHRERQEDPVGGRAPLE
jgi:hypothetical protein